MYKIQNNILSCEGNSISITQERYTEIVWYLKQFINENGELCLEPASLGLSLEEAQELDLTIGFLRYQGVLHS